MQIRTWVMAAASGAGMLLGTATAHATNLVTNGGFEAVQIAGGASANPADVPGWTHAGTMGDALLWNKRYCDGSGCIQATGDGNQFVSLGGGYAQYGTASWTQTVSGLVAGQAYDLTFKIAYEGADTFGLPQAITAAVGGTSQLYNATINGTNYWAVWEPQTLHFTATATSENLVFSVAQGVNDIGIDAVAINAVPEASTWAMLLLGLGFAGTALRARRPIPQAA